MGFTITFKPISSHADSFGFLRPDFYLWPKTSEVKGSALGKRQKPQEANVLKLRQINPNGKMWIRVCFCSHFVFLFKCDCSLCRQEALLAAISEKDANIALLELSSSKKKKTQEEVAALKREKDSLVQQLKQQVQTQCRHTHTNTHALTSEWTEGEGFFC